MAEYKTRVASTSRRDQQSNNSINKSWSHPSQWDSGEEFVLEPGVIIRENYRLTEKLGEGGMGVVWKAVDLIQEAGDSRNPYVAIKFLSRDFKDHPDALKALVREFSRYKKLTHTNILKAYGLDRIGDRFFMVMEFLEGIPLNKFIRNNPNGISLSEAEYIINDMAKALEHAHQNGVAHLDFKPANVLYDDELNIAKVIDFGIARRIEEIDEDDTTRFDPGSLGALTDSYASSEMFLGLKPDPRDDIYGFACVTYELLSGKHPYQRKKANQAENEKLSPQPIKSLNSQQNKALLHALAFNRNDRTPTAAQFLDEFFSRKKKKVGFVGKSIIIFLVLVVASISALTFFKKPQNTEIETEIIKEQVQQPKEPQPVVVVEEPPALACEQFSTKILLRDAHKYMQEYSIIYPVGDNALEKYQQVLELCPTNQEAKNGLTNIAESYKNKAKSSLIIGHIKRCQKHIDNALRAAPNDPDLIDFCKK
ncbi:serine/threonine-protein kinase [Candidatus Marithrix sp. Canyon 246]|uniref:serine/threonine-protein kinase n=1 Tax=Candidatus Marithrix sp. Canyon 246 TaxID=1827136 RepID=UPI00084A2C4F|nr:serine/threonine-protein kinase [Candidatus Marithrix sp. Canyon 246]